MDGEITEAPLQIQNVENHDIDQPDVVGDELAAQPEQENEENLQQQDQVGDQPEVELLPEQQDQPPEPNLVEPESQEQDPAPITGVRRSTRNRVQMKQPYITSMSGNKYEAAMAQLEQEGTLHPDAHMLFQQTAKEQPTAVSTIMTQLSLKAGLKRWGPRAKKSLNSEMKQLHLRDTFEPRNFRDLTRKEKAEVLESHLFLKEKRSGEIKGRTVAGGNN